MKQIDNNQGVSIIEVLLIIVAFGLLIGVAVPYFLGSIHDTKKDTDRTAAMLISDAAARVLFLDDHLRDLSIEIFDMKNLGVSVDEDAREVKRFKSALLKQLSHKVPVPVTRGYTRFVLIIRQGREIEVYLAGEEDKPESYVLLYPNADMAN